jgi:hypothetical protein
MCCPHTGHAYLNSLIVGAICVLLDLNIPFSKPDCNPVFSPVAAPGYRRPNLTGQIVLPWSLTAATANSFGSDFWRGSAQFGWRSGLSLPRTNKLKLELQ